MRKAAVGRQRELPYRLAFGQRLLGFFDQRQRVWARRTPRPPFAVVQQDGVAGDIGRLQVDQLLDALATGEQVQAQQRLFEAGHRLDAVRTSPDASVLFAALHRQSDRFEIRFQQGDLFCPHHGTDVAIGPDQHPIASAECICILEVISHVHNVATRTRSVYA